MNVLFKTPEKLPSIKLQAKRKQKSLLDDGTVAPSITTKHPKEIEVLTESCDWCLSVEAPWEMAQDDDDDILDTSAATETPANSQTRVA